ncbi:MAG TPA: indole-3-glycerol phosphate synthase TrpC [Caldilineae bacterium]|nr:indole-3-glycerol phosphate synthase TrpC [Caldilineae bacterium]
MKRQQRLLAQGKILEDIMRWKRQEVPKQKAEVPEANLRALALFTPPAIDFPAAIAGPGVSLIAEVKRASPSKGLLCKDFDPVQLALTYAKGGASAISCLTDARFFQGQLAYLTDIKDAFRQRQLELPVLRKDFIFDPYQVLEARVAGADALLLIMAVLGDAEYRDLLAYTHELGMTALVEVHNEAELARALKENPRVLGVNNRDLRDFSVDLNTTARLRAQIPADVLVVSESGIRDADDVRVLKKMGADAMLVGESLVVLGRKDRERKLKELVRARHG